MRRASILLVVLAVAIAGCTGASKPDAAGPSSDIAQGTRELETNSTEAVGTIEGSVTDDELRPLSGASVAILKLNAEVLTAPDGSFRFTNVPAGKQALVASKLGYQTMARTAEVSPTAVATVSFALGPISLVEPYYETTSHTLLLHAGSTYVTWAINLTGQQPACDGCTWTTRASESPDNLLVEIFGKHTLSNPAQGDGEYFWMFRNCYSVAGDAGCGERIINYQDKLPARVNASKAAIGKNTTVFWNQVLCDYYWFCYEERRDVYISFFYHMEIPETFTARPA